jgi:hypothetical protein
MAKLVVTASLSGAEVPIISGGSAYIVVGSKKTQWHRSILKFRPPDAGRSLIAKTRHAEGESRDVTPMLSALAEIPVLRNRRYPLGDFVTSWIRRYASEYLRALHHRIDFVRTATLGRLESHAMLPKYYRSERYAP